MRQIRHALSGAIYEQDGEGNVLVTKDGRTGTFDKDGRWLGGDIRHADPHLCNWIGGPMLVSRHAQAMQAASETAGKEQA